jgi:pilus assembly protein Flp/PilA
VAIVAINRKEFVAMRFLTKLLKDESGATAIEYGLIAGLVSVAAIGILTQMGGSLVNIFSVVSTELDKAASSAQNSGSS